MYLHLGNEIVVKNSDIVGIFDLDTTTVGKHTRNFLKKAEKSGQVIYVNYELPKAFVLCQIDGKTKIYITQISSSTLLKRAGGIK